MTVIETFGINLDITNFPFRFTNHFSATDTYIYEDDDKLLVFMEAIFYMFENPYGDIETDSTLSCNKSSITMDMLTGNSYYKIGKKSAFLL